MIVLGLLCTPAFGQTTAEDLLDQGNALLNQSKYDEAIQAFDKAIQLKPDFVDAHFAKGVDLNMQGKHDEANQPFIGRRDMQRDASIYYL